MVTSRAKFSIRSLHDNLTCDFLLALCNSIFILALTSSWSHVNGEKLVTFVNRCLAIRSHVTSTAILDEKGGKIP